MRLYKCDNCGKEIEETRYALYLGKVDQDENEVDADFCPECSQKIKKIILEGFQ